MICFSDKERQYLYSSISSSNKINRRRKGKAQRICKEVDSSRWSERTNMLLEALKLLFNNKHVILYFSYYEGLSNKMYQRF